VLFDTQRAARENRPVLNLEAARQGGAVVIFVLPPLLFQNAAPAIGQLIVNDLKAVTTTSRSTWKLFFDEFSVFSSVNVLNLLNMGRTFGLCGTLATQSLADFDAGAPELGSAFGRQVRASVNTVICHQVNDPDDAEVLAKFLGTSPDIELTARMQGEQFTGEASARAVRQFQIHPDDLKSLARGRAYVFNKNGTSALIAVRKSAI
jgi:type IV secretory pathway TraG/TraD family ATPase VirD4